MADPTEVSAPRLELLKALGDNTRYAIYLELARAPAPLATAQIADTLGLHANTVRPHLDRMREVGLLEVVTDTQGAVGRPQHRYSLAADAPSLGFEPPAFPVLARMLLRLAASADLPAGEAVEAGREQGTAAAGRPGTCAEALTHELAALGFDPESVVDDDGATIAFTRCPFRELAEANPDLVCSLHRGLVEGFVDARGDAEVVAFHDLADRTPCQVEIATARR
ncbi:MAG: helix-turn-helix domain-containing protein [Acidimicrobiales bacterium]